MVKRTTAAPIIPVDAANKTPIKTASIGQARNSIYSTSVKSFTKYEIG